MQNTEAETQTTLPNDSAIDSLANRMIEKLTIGAQRAQQSEKVAYANVRPEPDPVGVAKIASVCHDANRAYCAAFTREEHPEWLDAPKWQIDSAIEGVRKQLEHGHLDPEQSHNSWMSHKLRDGWRYGEVKDPEAKTHPCLLPYHELPLEQQLKDHLFGRIVDALRPLAFPDVTSAKELEAMRYQRGFQAPLGSSRY